LAALVAHPQGPVTLFNQSRGLVLATHVEPAFDSASRRTGLLGRPGLSTGCALAIAPCAAVHTFGMRFPIDALFIRRDGLVLKCALDVKPRRVAFAAGAFAVVEFGAGSASVAATRAGDRLALALPPFAY
jgi:uncharacterized membrane protein (UPF0127 family)